MGTPYALPARSHSAISMPETPPPCRAWKPNCLIFRKILSMLHGFSPRIRLLSISAYVLLAPSRTSPKPEMPWLVSIRMIGQVIGALATTATRRSVILRPDGFEAVFVNWSAVSALPSAKAAVANTAAAVPWSTSRLPINRSTESFIIAVPSTLNPVASRPHVDSAGERCRAARSIAN